jgi:hypothetical protein
MFVQHWIQRNTLGLNSFALMRTFSSSQSSLLHSSPIHQSMHSPLRLLNNNSSRSPVPKNNNRIDNIARIISLDDTEEVIISSGNKEISYIPGNIRVFPKENKNGKDIYIVEEDTELYEVSDFDIHKMYDCVKR